MLEVPKVCESRNYLFGGELQDWTSAGTASCRACKRPMSRTCKLKMSHLVQAQLMCLGQRAYQLLGKRDEKCPGDFLCPLSARLKGQGDHSFLFHSIPAVSVAYTPWAILKGLGAAQLFQVSAAADLLPCHLWRTPALGNCLLYLGLEPA